MYSFHAPVLMAVPSPVRALALHPAVVRAGAAGGAAGAPLEVLLPPRRLRGQTGGRHPARTAATQEQDREHFRISGFVVGVHARHVEGGGPRGVHVSCQAVSLGVVAQVGFESKV